jgi:hypothetical protein
MSNVETWPKYLQDQKMHFYFPCQVYFSLPFPTYFTFETKSEFGTTRAEKGVEDNFLNKHWILIK